LAATAATTGAEGVATTVAATVAIGAEDFTGLVASTELAVTVAMADLALPSWSPRPSRREGTLMWFVTNEFATQPRTPKFVFWGHKRTSAFSGPAFGAPPRRLLESRDEKHDKSRSTTRARITMIT
jgi:hypothetical protein